MREPRVEAGSKPAPSNLELAEAIRLGTAYYDELSEFGGAYRFDKALESRLEATGENSATLHLEFLYVLDPPSNQAGREPDIGRHAIFLEF